LLFFSIYRLRLCLRVFFYFFLVFVVILQSWTWVGSIHELSRVGSRLFPHSAGSGRVRSCGSKWTIFATCCANKIRVSVSSAQSQQDFSCVGCCTLTEAQTPNSHVLVADVRIRYASGAVLAQKFWGHCLISRFITESILSVHRNRNEYKLHIGLHFSS